MSQGRARGVLTLVGASLGALALLGVASLWGDREKVGDDLTTIEGIATQQQEVIDELVDTVEENRRLLEEEGIEPSGPPPEDIIDDLPEIDRPVAPLPPTDEQVEDAVVVVLEENPEMITSQVVAETTRYLIDNPPPAGADASDEQVFSAVVAFCSGPDAPCTGDDGQDGEDGQDAVLTMDMVVAALIDVCTTNPEICQSTVPGPVGDTGRGLVSLACVDGVLVATYDKEPFTQVVEGSSCQFPPGQDGKD